MFLIDAIRQHLVDMVEFALAITVRVKDAVVDQPECFRFRVDIDTGDNADATDDAVCIPTVLATD